MHPIEYEGQQDKATVEAGRKHKGPLHATTEARCKSKDQEERTAGGGANPASAEMLLLADMPSIVERLQGSHEIVRQRGDVR